MDFKEALKAMDMGNKVARQMWRGEISHWEMCKHCTCIHETYPNGTSTCFKAVELDDILATDWYLIT